MMQCDELPGWAPGGPWGSGGLHVGKAHVQFCVVNRVVFNPAKIVLNAIKHCAIDGNAFAADGVLLSRAESPFNGCAASLEDLGFDLVSDGGEGCGVHGLSRRWRADLSPRSPYLNASVMACTSRCGPVHNPSYQRRPDAVAGDAQPLSNRPLALALAMPPADPLGLGLSGPGQDSQDDQNRGERPEQDA